MISGKKRNTHKRVKTGHMPGEVSRRLMTAMRERRRSEDGEIVLPWGQIFNRNCAKAFRKYLQNKGRTVQRRRDRREIDTFLRGG